MRLVEAALLLSSFFRNKTSGGGSAGVQDAIVDQLLGHSRLDVSVTTLREFQNVCEMRDPAWRICVILRRVLSSIRMGRRPYNLVPSLKVPTRFNNDVVSASLLPAIPVTLFSSSSCAASSFVAWPSWSPLSGPSSSPSSSGSATIKFGGIYVSTC